MLSPPDNIIPFPAARTRLLGIVPPTATVPLGPLVAHDGRLYPVRALFGRLSPTHLADVAEAAPHSAQEAWDLCCRRWPALAAAIAASVEPIDERNA